MKRDWKDSPDGKKELVKWEQTIVLATVWWRVLYNWEECTEVKLFQITSAAEIFSSIISQSCSFYEISIFSRGSHASVKELIMWHIGRDYCAHNNYRHSYCLTLKQLYEFIWRRLDFEQFLWWSYFILIIGLLFLVLLSARLHYIL